MGDDGGRLVLEDIGGIVAASHASLNDGDLDVFMREDFEGGDG